MIYPLIEFLNINLQTFNVFNKKGLRNVYFEHIGICKKLNIKYNFMESLYTLEYIHQSKTLIYNLINLISIRNQTKKNKIQHKDLNACLYKQHIFVFCMM